MLNVLQHHVGKILLNFKILQMSHFYEQLFNQVFQKYQMKDKFRTGSVSEVKFQISSKISAVTDTIVTG